MATRGLMTTYKPMDLAFERGEGVWLFDTEGNRYLDCITGIAVCGLGHNHPRVTNTIQEQAARLLHTSNLYRIPHQETLGAKLADISGMEACFFGNSGAEANECAIKLARLYGHHKGIDNPTIVVVEQAFHGRTLATLSATGSRKAQAGFEPLVQGFVRAPYNDLEAIAQIGGKNDQVVAVMVEPVQGEAGINVPDPGYLSGLRQLCDRHGWLLILDEIQTGNGRTGSYFHYQQHGILPDVVTTAKGLGNGVPIGACLARGEAATTFTPGSHGSTYGGNPLCCATALTVLETLQDENLPGRAAELGERLLAGFRQRLAEHPLVQEVRGKGLMLGIQLTRPCAELVAEARQAGLLINVTAESVVRLLPPLILSDAEADEMLERVSRLLLDWNPSA